MSKVSLSFFDLPILILILCCSSDCRAENSSVCNPSSCGDNIKISYPFRLRTDPANCGHKDPIFELECQKNRTILHAKSRRYNVQAITYSNFSARISDPGLDRSNYSSCPIYSSTNYDLFSYMSLDYTNRVVLTFISCLIPVNNSLYIKNPVCAFSNSSRPHNYVTVERILLSDLEGSCTYDTMLEASSSSPVKDNNNNNNYSYSDIHDLMAYGFELTWYRAMCTECEEKEKGTCTLEDNKIRCRHYCYEDTPLSERSFLCKLVYYGPYLYIAALAIGAIVGLRFVFGIPFIIGLVVYKWRTRHSSAKESENIEELLKHQVNHIPINYTYSEIKKMTSNFKAKLGDGTVFKGNLRSGPFVAVKMLIKNSSNNSSNDKEFFARLSTISKISHPNVVKLIGFCIKGTKRALVHEFVQCGSLEKHVFLNEGMSYGDMFKISLGIARGIECLHHLGINLGNILLDEDFSPKISDSGLEKIYSKTGFVAPEVFYGNVGEISCKADVYSFGMVVLEMAGKVESLNPYSKKTGEVYFPSWIYRQLSEGKELGIGGEEEKKMVKKMIVVALWCIQIRVCDRPLMSEVVAMLEGDAELLHMPPLPFQRAESDEMIGEEI